MQFGIGLFAAAGSKRNKQLKDVTLRFIARRIIKLGSEVGRQSSNVSLLFSSLLWRIPGVSKKVYKVNQV